MIKNFIRDAFNKIVSLSVLVLLVLMFSKNNINFKEKVNYYLYEDNLSFMSIKKIYNKYLGGIYFFKNKNPTYMVFNSKLSYQNMENYGNGIKLEVIDNYLVPNLDSGIVIFIGNKDNFGNTIIIQTENNINIWYGNIDNSSLKVYDYVEKGEYLGETNGNFLYLAYSKGKNMLNYEKYFKNWFSMSLLTKN